MATELVAESTTMQRLLRRAKLYARSEVPVLLTGETGTGKTLLARWIHEHSLREAERFEARNCAAISETLAVSELFGHEKGAFTGAERNRSGAFRTASGGTLFLDEVSRLSPVVQGAILKAIDESVIQPLGSDETIEIDVRLLAATNQDLWQLADAGGFAEDLIQRLAVLTLDVPPLRDRLADLEPLANSFLRSENRPGEPTCLTENALALLRDYSFPGNIRELRSILEDCQLLAAPSEDKHAEDSVISETVVAEALTRRPRKQTARGCGPQRLADGEDALKRELLSKALRRHDGKITSVAGELGVSRQTISKWIRDFGLDSLRRHGK